jgi:MFS family permease
VTAVEVRGSSTAPDHRRRSFVGLTLSKVFSQPYGPVMGTYLTLVVATRASSAVAITFALTAHKYLSFLVFPIAGRLSDRTLARLGRRVPYMVGGLLVAGGAVWVFTVVDGYWPLVAAIVVAREATIVQRVARFAVTPDVFGRSRWIRAVVTMGAVTLLPGLGILAVIRFTWKQDDPSTWDLTYRLAAIGLVLAAVAIGWLVREAPASHLAAERAARTSWREELRRLLLVPNAKVLLVAGALLGGAGAATGRLFPVWANEVLGAGAPELVDISLLTGVLGFFAAIPGLWLAGRFHPRTLAVAAAVFGAVATGGHFFVTELWMFAVAATVAIPLAVAAIVAGLPLGLRIVPPGESLGESIGMFAGPLALVTSLAAYVSAGLVDVFDDYRLIWLVAAALTLAAAFALARLEVPAGEERTDVRALFRGLKARGGSGGLFGGQVEDADVLAETGQEFLAGRVADRPADVQPPVAPVIHP